MLLSLLNHASDPSVFAEVCQAYSQYPYQIRHEPIKKCQCRAGGRRYRSSMLRCGTREQRVSFMSPLSPRHILSPRDREHEPCVTSHAQRIDPQLNGYHEKTAWRNGKREMEGEEKKDRVRHAGHGSEKVTRWRHNWDFERHGWKKSIVECMRECGVSCVAFYKKWDV